MNIIDDKDQKLYEEAEARVKFRNHLGTYFIVNIFLWALWYFTDTIRGHFSGYWPVYTTLGWGIGIFSHYLKVYVRNTSAVEREYEKLKKKKYER